MALECSSDVSGSVLELNINTFLWAFLRSTAAKQLVLSHWTSAALQTLFF
jgi:hypothetical protein